MVKDKGEKSIFKTNYKLLYKPHTEQFFTIQLVKRQSFTNQLLKNEIYVSLVMYISNLHKNLNKNIITLFDLCMDYIFVWINWAKSDISRVFVFLCFFF